MEKWPKIKELRTLPEAELQVQLQKARQTLWQDRLKAREGALQQTHELRLTKRHIARLQTVMNALQKPREATSS